MKLLVVGNSQAGALKRAYDDCPELWRGTGIALYFYVIPGGMGPNIRVFDDRFELGKTAADHPPYVSPADTTQMRLSEFDAVLISALGYFDGGFAYVNPITTSGVLTEFSPRGEARRHAPVSAACYRELMFEQFRRQPGFRALRSIAESFKGKLLVQPFPNISDEILNHSDWGLRKWYANPLGAYRFMAGIKEEFLRTETEQFGAELIDYAVAANENNMTPHSFMRETDGVHQNDRYGDLVLRQLRSQLQDVH